MAARKLSFPALRHPAFVTFWGGVVLTMMADNMEHVISYWVMYQKFQSAELGGFAVISHWLPFLLGSMTVSRLADRFDPRRFVVLGMTMFMIVSLSWAWLIATDGLQIWHAWILLTLHGVSGTLWNPAAMLLLYDVVPAEHLNSAVRLHASGRMLGMLLGPGVGNLMMLAMPPHLALLFNALFFLPLLIWALPRGRPWRIKPAHLRPGNSGLDDLLSTMREVGRHRTILYMMLLAGFACMLVGNSYQAQMPGFAALLGHADPGLAYSLLLGADAAGALTAGIVLEARSLLTPRPRTALVLGLIWCLALIGFALSTSYALVLPLLFIAGFVELSFFSMSQALVQMNAPPAMRGRVVGLYSLASAGMRTFSGLSVGVLGGLIGIRASLSGSAIAVMVLILMLLYFSSRPQEPL